MVIAPSDRNVVWAGTGETFIRSNISIGNGIYKSTDAGKTWLHMGLRRTGRIVIDPRDPPIAWPLVTILQPEFQLIMAKPGIVRPCPSPRCTMWKWTTTSSGLPATMASSHDMIAAPDTPEMSRSGRMNPWDGLPPI